MGEKFPVETGLITLQDPIGPSYIGMSMKGSKELLEFLATLSLQKHCQYSQLQCVSCPIIDILRAIQRKCSI